ncbi:mannose-1-phosphate guanylyltransferase [Trueperella bonasi]|uniref:Mannose-1-phosphate guanylyltransferase n=1 Tax=Trueperella bonasi TaxID=312286 RepID=A0ABT9NEI0_9ACTO|nr:mannose-1-phosphate guanylyltransferase [Trueperella bonasi]MDP9805796.1 mannose-1-phosphate guanylyltransferase [Trueperella bonasi]
MIYSIVPAGGAGTRLWPLSRKNHPKFLTDLTGAGRTLIQKTVDRLSQVSRDTVIVTGMAHSEAVKEQLKQIPAENVIAEPSPRDSMAAIALATAVVQERHGDVVVGSFAADHLIQNEPAFHNAVREAERAAERDYLVTIGIAPDHPATGFGYIRGGEKLEGMESARAVVEFVEKPDIETARRYVEGHYLWNAGMFVAKTSVLLGALEKFEPELYRGIIEIARAYDTEAREETLAQVWPGLKKIAIDHAIAEPLAEEGGVAVVPADMGWSDVGDFASLRDVLDVGAKVSPGGSQQPVVTVDAPGALVYTHSKPIAIVGIEDAVVVETDDAILLTTRPQAQAVKDVVARLADQGRDDLC